MSLIPKKNLDFWIEKNLNVLLVGHAGCGKTHTVLEAFQKHNLKYQYYSCSTLDPYVDFIGVPREIDDPTTGTKVLDLVRPKQWANDEIEALFLDEYNRSKMAVRNAVMELIQFRSINGKKFNKLRMVWAAINPDESEGDITYDVEPLDPAQKDRFHIHFDVPYEPDMEYMERKFGKTSAKLAIEWWKGLDKNTKMIVSPRRLDYAVEIHNLGGDINFVVPKIANPESLRKRLGSMSVVEKINSFMDKNFSDINAVKVFFENETNYHFGINYIVENNKTWSRLLPHIPMEKFNALIVTKGNEKIMGYTIANETLFSEFFDEIAKMSDDSSLKRIICSNVLKNNSVTEELKNKLGLNKKTLIASIGSEKQEAYIKDAISKVSGWMSTAAKVKLMIDYINQFSDITIDKGGKFATRTDDILRKEADMLNAVANRMHSYSFAKALEKDHWVANGVGRIKLMNFFAQTKPFLIAFGRPFHFKPILDMK